MHCGGEREKCEVVSEDVLSLCDIKNAPELWVAAHSFWQEEQQQKKDRFLPPAGWRHLLLNLGIVSDLPNVFIFSAWGDALSSHFPDCPCVSDETCSTLCLLLKQESRWWWGHTGQHCVQNLPVQDVRWGGLGCHFTAPTPRMMNSATIYRKLATYFSNLWLTDDVKKPANWILGVFLWHHTPIDQLQTGQHCGNIFFVIMSFFAMSRTKSIK